MSTTYKPDDDWPGFTSQQAIRLRKETAAIKAAEESDKPTRRFTVRHAAPAKANSGDVVFADGEDWNPGYGEGLYFRDKANSRWRPIPTDGFVSVKSFKAKGDGTTNDDDAVQRAVAQCNTSGEWLYWPNGTYLTTETVPNFHSVRHFGPGIVKRGSDLFYITPTDETNTIYVATTGSNSNDGLSSSQPKLTIQSAIDSLDVWRTQIASGGTWKISIGAGTFSRGRFPDEGLISRNRIQLVGVDVGGHPNVPTTLIKEGATQSAVGLMIFSGMNVYVKDIKIEDYNGSTSSCGINAAGAILYTDNVHVTDCYYGISVGQFGTMNVKGGIIDDCGYLNSTTAGGYGLRGIFHTKFEVGTQNAGALTGGPIIQNCSGALLGQELCTGHLDWTTIHDNASGVRLTVNSRLNIDGSSFKRNGGSAIYATAGSYADATSNTVFGTGADANTRDFSIGHGALASGSSISSRTLSNAADNHCFETAFPNTVVTSTSSVNTIDSYTLIGGAFAGTSVSQIPAKKVTVVVKGTLAGTTGTYKRVAVRLGASTVVFASFGAVTGAFEVRLDVHFISTSVQLISSFGSVSGQAPYIANGAGAVDMSSNQTIALQAYVHNSADSITISSYEWFVQGV